MKESIVSFLFSGKNSRIVAGVDFADTTTSTICYFEVIGVRRGLWDWLSYVLFWAELPPQKTIIKQVDATKVV